MAVSLQNPRLFVRKTLTTVVAAFLLLPLVQFKSDVPTLAYLGGLVLLHVFVLGIYLYRVRFTELDGDVRSLGARVAALIVVVYLLTLFSKVDSGTSTAIVLRNIAMVTLLHTAIIALLMVRIGDDETAADDVAAPNDDQTATTTVVGAER